jgi:hypothetical protein
MPRLTTRRDEISVSTEDIDERGELEKCPIDQSYGGEMRPILIDEWGNKIEGLCMAAKLRGNL